jgi:hypothetical protein
VDKKITSIDGFHLQEKVARYGTWVYVMSLVLCIDAVALFTMRKKYILQIKAFEKIH